MADGFWPGALDRSRGANDEWDRARCDAISLWDSPIPPLEGGEPVFDVLRKRPRQRPHGIAFLRQLSPGNPGAHFVAGSENRGLLRESEKRRRLLGLSKSLPRCSAEMTLMFLSPILLLGTAAGCRRGDRRTESRQCGSADSRLGTGSPRRTLTVSPQFPRMELTIRRKKIALAAAGISAAS